MIKETLATIFLGLVLQGYISNTAKPGYIGIMATVFQPISITDVFHGTPAERAGLKARDIIVDVDGSPGGEIKGEPGSVVTLTIRRQGTEFKVQVTRAPITEMPPEFPRD